MLGVGRQRSNLMGVHTVRHDVVGSLAKKLCWKLHHAVQPFYNRIPGARQVAKLSHSLAESGGRAARLAGREDFHYPGTSLLLNMAPHVPNVLHLHNLHGHYFDLRAVPLLSRSQPTLMTLHDAWLMTGHCAHSLSCEKWRMGCGQCPDLNLYPAIRQDATRENWQTKRGIFASCSIHVAAPSKWLMDKALNSLMAPAIISSRIIPNGVDTGVYRPIEKAEARETLNLPQDSHILLFSAYNASKNSWKDFPTIRNAITRLRRSELWRRLLLVVLGETKHTGSSEDPEIRFVPFESDQQRVACWYSAADLYVHAARADTFPNSILEAMACGTPAVATAVGGIPEQIQSTDWFGLGRGDQSKATGVLTPSGDSTAMAIAIERLLTDQTVRHQMTENSVRDVESRFTLKRQADEYLDWYRELIDMDRSRQPDSRRRTNDIELAVHAN